MYAWMSLMLYQEMALTSSFVPKGGNFKFLACIHLWIEISKYHELAAAISPILCLHRVWKTQENPDELALQYCFLFNNKYITVNSSLHFVCVWKHHTTMFYDHTAITKLMVTQSIPIRSQQQIIKVISPSSLSPALPLPLVQLSYYTST